MTKQLGFSGVVWSPPPVVIFMKSRLEFKMHLGSSTTHFQLPPITTGRLRHLQDATNHLAI